MTDKGQKTYHLKFRFDYIEELDNYCNATHQVISTLTGGAVPYTGTVGVETLNALGARIKPHLHYHFETFEKPDTIRARVKRAYPDRKRFYTLKEEQDVIDRDRFYRYCHKQIEPINLDVHLESYRRVKLPDNYDVVLQNQLAFEEWTKSRDIMTEKNKENLSRLTVYEKILILIKSDNPELTTVSQCKLYVLDYYTRHNIPPQKQKIIDMAMGISLSRGIITQAQYLLLD